MSVEDEQTMDETSPVDVDGLVDEFDVGAFLEGVRSARVAVTIYRRGDLAVEESRLQTQMAEASLSGNMARTRVLRKELDKVQAEYFSSGFEIVLEERSDDWTRRETARLRDEGVTGKDEIVYGLLAGQIVEPQELKGDRATVAGIARVLPGQFRKLAEAWKRLQGYTDEKAMPGF